MDPLCFCQMAAGLCNQLFQVATGYAHCRRTGQQLRLPAAGSRYWESYFHKCIRWQGGPVPAGRVWREPRFSYAPIPADARNLVGFFQSAKYFADVSGEIRALFDLPAHLKAAAGERHRGLLTPAHLENGVVVHIRRGDYLIGQNRIKHGILDERYYRRATEAARSAISNSTLLVFSDDLEWCRSQPWLADAIFVDESNDVAALWLMSRFRNFIMSNSTFSWWAAWLSDAKTCEGRVWTPDRWFGPTGPSDYQDVYESEWIRIPIV